MFVDGCGCIHRDPMELHNLAGDQSHAEILQSLQVKLKAWQRETNDPWMVKYIHE